VKAGSMKVTLQLVPKHNEEMPVVYFSQICDTKTVRLERAISSYSNRLKRQFSRFRWQHRLRKLSTKN